MFWLPLKRMSRLAWTAAGDGLVAAADLDVAGEQRVVGDQDDRHAEARFVPTPWSLSVTLTSTVRSPAAA